MLSPARYHDALDFEAYVASAEKLVDFWRGVYRAASTPVELVERASRLKTRWHLLVLSEDWCGDAVNTVPVLTRFVEAVGDGRLDLRILSRDRNPDLMDGHLTGGTRSIPVVMALDDEFIERGWWGPRPSRLQRWVRCEGRLLPKEERYKKTRSWYARDRGRTTIEEVLGVMERWERRPHS